MKKHNILALILAFCSVWLASGQTLTLDSCRARALAHNRNVAMAAETAEKARHTVAAMRTNYFPKIAAGGAYLYSNSSLNYTLSGGYLPTYSPLLGNSVLYPNLLYDGGGNIVMGEDGNPVFTSYAYMPDVNFNVKLSGTYYANVSLDQPIYWGGKITAGYRMAKIGAQMADLNEAKTEQEVLLNVEEAYWNCVRAKELQVTAEQYMATVEEFYRTAQDAVKVDMASTNDLNKVQVKLSEARLQVAKVANARKVAAMNLCQQMGMPLYSEIDVETSDSFDEIPVPTDVDLSNRAEYELLCRNAELKKEEVALTRSDYLPQVGVKAMYGYGNGIRVNDSKMMDKMMFGGVLSVNIPITHWGEGAHKTKAAKNDQSAAELQRDEMAEKMLLEVQLYRNALEEAQLKLTLCEETVAQTAESHRIMTNRYNQGLETTAAFLESQTTDQKARTDLVEARADLHIARSRLLKALGLLQ